MSLPKLQTPTFFVTIPSTQKKVKIRPFLVKEEKILLIAMGEKDEDVMIEALKDILEGCTFGDVNVGELTNFDLDYLFLQLYIRSRGPVKELKFKCENVLEDGHKCSHINSVQLDLESVEIYNDPEHTKKIMLTDTVGLIMKYPSFAKLKELHKLINQNDVTKLYDIFASFIDTVFEGDQIFDSYSEQEMREFIETFTDEQFGKVKKFFETMPRLQKIIKIKCAKCGHEESITLEGLQNFLE